MKCSVDWINSAMKAIVLRLLGPALVLILFAGCASKPEDRMMVARDEVARMPQPARPFKGYSGYELLPFILSEAVAADEDKVEVAKELEEKLQAHYDRVR